MKKNYFLALILMTGFASSALAQQSSNIDLDAKALVSAQVAVTKVSDLDFKNVNPGVNKTISLLGVATPAATATGGETKGQFLVTKSAGTQVTLSLTGLNDLAGPSSATLGIVYTHQISKAGETSVNIGTPASFAIGTSNPFWTAETFNVDLGGTVSPLSNQTPGIYTATINLTATYN